MTDQRRGKGATLRALDWALREAATDCPTCVLVLVGLADHVNGELVAWPSVGTLSEYARCSSRTVQRHLRDLEEAELVVSTWHPGLERYPADRRPTAYRLELERGDRLTPRGVTDCRDGVTPVTRRGDTGVTRTSQEPPKNTSGDRLTPRVQLEGGDYVLTASGWELEEGARG